MKRFLTPWFINLTVVSTIVALLLMILIFVLGESERTLSAATVALVTATLILGFATLRLAQVAFDELDANRKDVHDQIAAAKDNVKAQIQAAREQNENTQRVAQRPLLVPANAPTNEVNKELWVKVGTNDQTTKPKLRIQNIGFGVATNVSCILMPPRGNGHGAYYASSFFPIPHNNTNIVDLQFVAAYLGFDNDDKLQEHELGPDSTQLDPPDGEYLFLCRITITYADIFHRKHASIFDLTNSGSWRSVAIEPDIKDDVDDLILKRAILREELSKQSPVQ